jgi:hypothetical protein
VSKVCIAVPTHNYNDKSSFFLKRLFNSILSQNFKDYSICISDQSTNKDVFDVYKKYSEEMNIKYIKNSSRKNSTENINNSLFNSEGEIVKIMFMDDYFYSNDAIGTIVEKMELNNSIWSLCSTHHYKEDLNEYGTILYPTWNGEGLLLGHNTIGSPTVMSYRKENEMLFDEKLRLLVDVELYYRMMLKHGMPDFINSTLVVTSLSESSTVGKMGADGETISLLMKKESLYCKNKLIDGVRND